MLALIARLALMVGFSWLSDWFSGVRKERLAEKRGEERAVQRATAASNVAARRGVAIDEEVNRLSESDVNERLRQFERHPSAPTNGS